MPIRRDAMGRFAPANFFMAQPIPKPKPKPKVEQGIDFDAQIVELRRLLVTQYQGALYQYGSVHKDTGNVRVGAGPCFGSAGEYGRQAKVFGTHVFGAAAWRVSKYNGHEAWQKGPMLEYIRWLLNDSCFAPVFLTKDAEDVVKNGALFDPENFSAQYIWCAACALRDCTEYSHIIDTWIELRKFMDPNKALFFAHIVQYQAANRVFTPLLSLDSHHWICYRISKAQLKQMVRKTIDPLGGNDEPLCHNIHYRGLAGLFGSNATWAPVSFLKGPGMAIKNTFGMISNAAPGSWKPEQIADAVANYCKTHGLEE